MFDIYNAHLTRIEDLRNECLEQQQIHQITQEQSRKNRIFRHVWNRKHQSKLA
ncbi:hypothetical protein EDC24_1803 [Aquisalibacillus elongatus]|uniref:Uncharacterized protein n=1 Tax=Aquisalibacillus elongatus TaxID=485577 RepID=A0A3N5B6I6_9BACI|nr:hypothetical protein EDC24_1803 [Aquisalibacillus elongatus]